MDTEVANFSFARPSEARLLSQLIWKLTLAATAASLAAAALAGIRFTHAASFLFEMALCIEALLAVRVIARRRRMDDERLLAFLDIIPAYLVFTFALVVAQQAAGARAVPDLTGLAQRLDAAFGFDWFDYVREVSSVPYLDPLLAFCYRNWIGAFVIVMAGLAYVRDFEAIGEFTLAYALTSLVTMACFASFDVVHVNSAAVFHLPGFHHTSAGGPHYLHALRQLRSGANTTLDFNHLDGMIAIPSLHGAGALLLAAATRGLRRWGYPLLAFNILVLVSTFSEGGHYLIDEIVTAPLVCIALAVARPLYLHFTRDAWDRAAPALAAGSASPGYFSVDRPAGCER